MRRLLIALCVLGTLIVAGPAHAAPAGDHIDVISVSGLIDPVQADFIHNAVRGADTGGAEVLVIQLTSGGGVLSQARTDALADEIAHSNVPVAVWVGPSGKGRAYGTAYAIVRAAAIVGVANGTHVGESGRTIGAAQALTSGVATLNAPTLVDFIGGLDGKVVGGKTLSTDVEVVQTARGPRRQPHIEIRFSKLPLLASLMHTVASPSVAYLLLLAGLLLLVFEFFTAGVGIGAAVGAGCLVLAAYGLTVLPVHWWAVALLVLAVFGYTVDLQAGQPRFWTAIGTLSLVVGTLGLSHGPHASVLAMIVGVAGTPLFMVAGMPSMIRARFSTPTIGRQSMVGKMGTALADVSPEGMVEISGAQWRARTNRATPIPAGEPVRVTGIDGLLLEVEPEAGGAKDYRR